MGKSASEIISELELRIARLEKNATQDEKWKISFSVQFPDNNRTVNPHRQGDIANKVSKLIGLKATGTGSGWETDIITARELQKVVSIIERETTLGADGIEFDDLVARAFEFTSLSPLTFSIEGITYNSRDIYQSIVK